MKNNFFLKAFLWRHASCTFNNNDNKMIGDELQQKCVYFIWGANSIIYNLIKKQKIYGLKKKSNELIKLSLYHQTFISHFFFNI